MNGMRYITVHLFPTFTEYFMSKLELSQDQQAGLIPNVVSFETLISQGAEARVYRTKLFHSTYTFPCIVKERFVKRYRHSTLDSTLSMQRMRAEVRQLLRCREVGIDVPPVLLVDIRRRRIWLGEVGPDAVTLQDWFKNLFSFVVGSNLSNMDIQRESASQLLSLSTALGRLLAQLHSNHIIHGDLTMANILVQQIGNPNKESTFRVVPIDFGLSSASSGLTSQRLAEDKAVDLYVFERALTCGLDHKALLKATVGHSDLSTPESLLNLIMNSYRENYISTSLDDHQTNSKYDDIKSDSHFKKQENEVKEILNKLDDVRLRGRKRLMIG
ncbi:EKC/KEOPS complex subunit bud32 [Schistosoma japonicum]|uniref:non-specific serine/threonine protein kinase n=1 Tax=Schistosoma japonicum TaxID=6182 RepID=A0A4Z2CQD4_SCHJA|nr:EKC/KEOPS complex subunit bud32 [Schistosoma japonicum]